MGAWATPVRNIQKPTHNFSRIYVNTLTSIHLTGVFRILTTMRTETNMNVSSSLISDVWQLDDTEDLRTVATDTIRRA